VPEPGTLGARLHPPFLHFPIAFWTAGTALDVLQRATGWSLPGVDGYAAGHGLLWGGVLAALATVGAGLFDFARLPRAVQDGRALKWHMLAMSSAFTAFLVAGIWRAKTGAFAAPPAFGPLLLEVLGAAALVVGGHFGGRVVFHDIPRALGGGPRP